MSMSQLQQEQDFSPVPGRAKVIRANFEHRRRVQELETELRREAKSKQKLQQQLDILQTGNETLRLNNDSLFTSSQRDRLRIDGLRSGLKVSQEDVVEANARLQQLTSEHNKMAAQLVQCSNLITQQCREIDRLGPIAADLQVKDQVNGGELLILRGEIVGLRKNYRRLSKRYRQATSVKAMTALAYRTFMQVLANAASSVLAPVQSVLDSYKVTRIERRFKNWNVFADNKPKKTGLYIVSDGQRYARCHFNVDSREFRSGSINVCYWTDKELV